jgi:hypothetical protein
MICDFLYVERYSCNSIDIYNQVDSIPSNFNAEISAENMQRLIKIFKEDLFHLKNLTGFAFSSMIQSRYH